MQFSGNLVQKGVNLVQKRVNSVQGKFNFFKYHKFHSPYGLASLFFCVSLKKNLLVLIYSKLHSKSCDYLYKFLVGLWVEGMLVGYFSAI